MYSQSSSFQKQGTDREAVEEKSEGVAGRMCMIGLRGGGLMASKGGLGAEGVGPSKHSAESKTNDGC